MKTTIENVIWTSTTGEQRVIRHDGKHYPQRHIIGTDGLGWYYQPEYRGYKTLAGAKKAS
jgi:hypothetical protein